MVTVRFSKHYFSLPFLILCALEFFTLYASVYFAAFIRFSGAEFEMPSTDIWLTATIFALTILVCLISMGLYQTRSRVEASSILLRVAMSYLAGGALLMLIFYSLPGMNPGRGVLALSTIISFFVIGTIHPVFFNLIDEDLLKRKVLVYGAGKRAANLEHYMRRKSDRRGFEIVGYVKTNENETQVEDEKHINIGDSINSYSKLNNISEVIVAPDDMRGNLPIDDLLSCKMDGITVLDIQKFIEREARRIEVEILNPGWLLFDDGFKSHAVYAVFKRLFDLAASLLILAVTWPFMLATALAISIEEGFKSPKFYKQIRVGLNGENFEVIKFRSMRIDAESDGKARWATKNDSRITRVGDFIRKTRLDELPQIFNVLKGEMSFIGPRPERPEIIENLRTFIPLYDERHRVKPGITGWAQLKYPYGASDHDAVQKQKYDLYYTKNWSLLLDLLILMQTVEIVLFGKGR